MRLSVVRGVTRYQMPRAALAAAVAIVALGLSVASFPEIERGPVVCPFRVGTGLPCPTCGFLRTTHLLLRGRLGAAFATNPLDALALLVAAPGTLALWVANATGRWAIRVSLSSRERRVVWLALVAAALANWIYVLVTQT